MRNLLSILAMGCLLFLTGGYSLVYTLRRAEVRSEAKAAAKQLCKSELTPLTFTTSELANLQWENSNEFHYRGEMFDLVETETKGDKIVCWCLSDEKESSLVNALLNTQNSSEKDSSKQLVKLLQAPFLPVRQNLATKRLPAVVQHQSRLELFFPSTDSAVLLPPPKVVG